MNTNDKNTNQTDSISRLFDTKESVTAPNIDAHKSADWLEHRKEMLGKKDGEYAQENIRELIEEAMGLLPSLVSVTREAERAAMYDSASKFMQMLASLNKDLHSLSTAKAKDEAPKTNNGEVDLSNVAFIGTASTVLDGLAGAGRIKNVARRE